MSSVPLNELCLAALTLSIVFLTILWYKLTSNISHKEESRLPPGPRGLPIVGFLPFLRPNLHHQLTELSQQYGPIYKFWLGSKLCVVLNSPSLAKQVVRDQDSVFANRDPPIAGLVATYGGLDIGFSPYGSYWRDMRKLFVREMLSNRNLEACYSLRRHEVRKTIRNVHTKIGNPIDIGELAFVTEMNVIMSMIFGSNFVEEKDRKDGAEFRELVIKFLQVIGKPNISDFFPMLSRFDLQGIQKEMEALSMSVDSILDPAINERMKMLSNKREGEIQGNGKKDFMQILLDLMEQKDIGISVDLVKIKAILVDIVIGGTDTTITTVEWVMAELLNNPEIMSKVQQELKDVVGMNNIVEESHLSELHYLDAVLKETLRLHPALPLLLPKRPSQSAVVGGYTIPEGTKVFLNVYAIHRDPQVWESPLEFQPERFLMSQSTNLDYSGNNMKYLPFGSGRRICAGLPLAEKMLMFILASLLHSFDWKLPQGENVDLSEGFGLVIKKSKRLFAIPTPKLPHLDLYQ